MATQPVARTLGSGGTQARVRRRLSVRLALPLVLALAALSGIAGVALASGTGASVAVDPSAGPVGTQVTVKGSSFTPGDQIQVGYAAGNCSSGVTIISGATGTVGSDGTVTVIFKWPNTKAGAYTICVVDKTNGHTYSSSNTFTVTNVQAPAITVSSPVISGQPVTVKGTNWSIPGGGTVEILYGPAGGNACATSAGTATLNSDGTFTFTFNAPFEATATQITITAVYPQGSCSGDWILRASQTVTVQPAVTPTPSPSATSPAHPTPTATTSPPEGVVFPPTFPPTPAETVVYCLVGLLLLLLLLLLFLLLSRSRRQNQPTTIRQQDTPLVNSQGRPGAPMVQSSIYAENPRNQRRTQIAEEVTTIQEEPINPPNPPSGGQFGQPPRFGPASGNSGPY
jgi:hypothetical protein